MGQRKERDELADGRTMDERVQHLRGLLLDAKDLNQIGAYFMDALAERHDFMAAGVPEENKRLDAVLRRILEGARPKEPFSPALALHLPDYSLWHGTGTQGMSFVAFVYFADLDMGLCMLAGLNDGVVHYYRFSVTQLPTGIPALSGRVTRGVA